MYSCCRWRFVPSCLEHRSGASCFSSSASFFQSCWRAAVGPILVPKFWSVVFGLLAIIFLTKLMRWSIAVTEGWLSIECWCFVMLNDNKISPEISRVIDRQHLPSQKHITVICHWFSLYSTRSEVIISALTPSITPGNWHRKTKYFLRRWKSENLIIKDKHSPKLDRTLSRVEAW